MNIEVNRNAKAYHKEEIVINASAEKVYQVLADINNWPAWQSGVASANMEGEAEPGKEFRWKAGGSKISSKLHTVNPHTEFGWTGRALWIKAVHNWTFTEKEGATTVVVEESMSGFLSGLMKKTLKESLPKSLKDLKKEAERG